MDEPDEDFVSATAWVLNDIKANLDPVRRSLLDRVGIWVHRQPTPYHIRATGTPDGHILLGAYDPEPSPNINIFQTSIEKIAQRSGDILTSIREVLNHEIWQHAFGTDHTRETLAHGLLPALIIPEPTCNCGRR